MVPLTVRVNEAKIITTGFSSAAETIPLASSLPSGWEEERL